MTHPLQHRVGHRFTGGTVTVPHWENWLWCDAVLAEHPAHRDPAAAKALGYDAPVVHPGLVYFACVRGARTSFAEIFRLMEFDEADGPMFGEQHMEFVEPVLESVEYRGEGGITALERKEGRRAGVFDVCSFEIQLKRDDRTVVISRSSFILPRRHLS